MKTPFVYVVEVRHKRESEKAWQPTGSGKYRTRKACVEEIKTLTWQQAAGYLYRPMKYTRAA